MKTGRPDKTIADDPKVAQIKQPRNFRTKAFNLKLQIQMLENKTFNAARIN